MFNQAVVVNHNLQFIRLHFNSFTLIPFHSSSFQFIPVHSSSFQFISLYTNNLIHIVVLVANHGTKLSKTNQQPQQSHRYLVKCTMFDVYVVTGLCNTCLGGPDPL